jgi:hypothetical protein
LLLVPITGLLSLLGCNLVLAVLRLRGWMAGLTGASCDTGGVVVAADDGASAANAAGISTSVTPSFTVVFEGWPSMSMMIHFRRSLSFTENCTFISIVD